ncbi:hypothetical protein MLD38_002867 [Melastoma candidum]|uniref:Uncharacterized protein n=1 Tax=Melastoma candidum TaxID=119954 RepID=A0ACB9S2B0_9MYRT|nr:hypothetical protein MLD38_002867 [Melastoma candidum]
MPSLHGRHRLDPSPDLSSDNLSVSSFFVENLLLHLFLVATTLFPLFGPSSVALSTPGDDQVGERSHLLDFKHSLDDPEMLASWNDDIHYCEWDGVLCQDGVVVSLSLSGQSLKGPLSRSLFALSGLVSADLSFNSFSGELSGEVSNLRNLNVLSLSNNGRSGELPARLGELAGLETLKLGFNSFVGRVPPELGMLNRLQMLELSSNALVGELPSELSGMSRLRFLDFANNLLSGPLPGSMLLTRCIK